MSSAEEANNATEANDELQTFEEVLKDNEKYSERVKQLEEELKKCKAEMAVLSNSGRVHETTGDNVLGEKDDNSMYANKENEKNWSQDGNAASIESLARNLAETTHERDELKKLVKELRTQIDDYKRVNGSLDDLSELRHQYENLLDDDYDFVNNIAFADVMLDGTSRSFNSTRTKREIDRICNDLKQFMSEVKMNDSTEDTEEV